MLVAAISRLFGTMRKESMHRMSIEPIRESPMYIPGVGNLRAIASLDGKIAWAGGTEGKIARTEDGGNTWSLCSLPEGKALDVRAICLMGQNIACAMCAGPAEKRLSRIYRTEDGGKIWTEVFCPEGKGIFFNAMAFWNGQEGVVLSDPVDGRFVLFETKDGGSSWNRLKIDSMPIAFPNEGAFAASNSCLAVFGQDHVWFGTGGGESARVFYSSDHGRNWDVAQTPMKIESPTAGIFSLAFLNNKEGIAVGGDYQNKNSFSSHNILGTSDGGKSWQPIDNPDLSKKYLSAVMKTFDGRWAVVDGSCETFNAAVITQNGGYAVGPNSAWAKLKLA